MRVSLVRSALLPFFIAVLGASSCSSGSNHPSDAGADRASASGGTGGGSQGGSGGAGQSTGGSPHDGGAGGGATGDGGSPFCPMSRPTDGTACDAPDPCAYGPATCTCIDPGVNGHWQCQGGDSPDASNPAACPADEPQTGDPCTTAVEHCLYPDYACDCVPADGWTCFI